MTYGMCKSCYRLKKVFSMKGEYWGNNIYMFSCTNPNHVYSTYRKWNGRKFVPVQLTTKVANSQYSGKGVRYWDGGKERYISQELLRKIKSTVTTHEGQLLTDKAGRAYMDNYSKLYLGKDLSGSYNSHSLTGSLPK